MTTPNDYSKLFNKQEKIMTTSSYNLDIIEYLKTGCNRQVVNGQQAMVIDGVLYARRRASNGEYGVFKFINGGETAVLVAGYNGYWYR